MEECERISSQTSDQSATIMWIGLATGRLGCKGWQVLCIRVASEDHYHYQAICARKKRAGTSQKRRTLVGGLTNKTKT